MASPSPHPERRGDARPAPEIIRDARGFYWRKFPPDPDPVVAGTMLEDGFLSMVPNTNDNLPVPEPWTYYLRIGTRERAVEAIKAAHEAHRRRPVRDGCLISAWGCSCGEPIEDYDDHLASAILDDLVDRG